MDDQLYRLALSQKFTGDPFGTETFQREGWSVSRSTDDNGNHVITMSKVLSRDDLNSSGQPTPALRGMFVPFSSLQVSRSRGFFVEQDSLTATVPALLPLVQSQLRPPYDDLASAMFSAAVALHFELRTPGNVLETNGERTPSGFVRWDLSLQAPTRVLYAVRVVHVDRIIVVLLVALAALMLSLHVAGRYLPAPKS